MPPRTGARRGLTLNHRLVFDALKAAKRPLTAYELIDRLRGAGITAPPTVYRALTRLVDDSLAHRLESLNAFVACSHPHGQHKAAVFAICDDCGSVSELLDAGISSTLGRRAAAQAFVVKSTVVELHGSCARCSESASQAQ